ncbi:MAG TPA: 3-oxoacyl-[acyl-carrier-protein] reductase [Gemmatimonadota bacterium]|nr:3-oxoacyl-[acyl-carrier-protein] reductase [Gemmatimonadota bacterium]
MGVTIDLGGKRALVTGGNRGIGRAIAERLADAGADVAVFARSEESVTGAARALSGRGVRGLGLVGDVGSDADVERAWDTLMKEFGQLDVLVNNAGITRDGLLLRMKPEDWQAVLDINLTGAFRWCRLAAKQMLRQRSGSIINISSIVGVIGNPGQTNYAASKAGLIGFSKSLAVEVAARGITVNVIAPGFIETEMTHVLGEGAQAEFLSRIPLGKLGTTGDVADLALFLASPMSDYITGQVICVDGGLTR